MLKFVLKHKEKMSPFLDNSQTLRTIMYMGSSILAVILVGALIATFIHLKARSARRRSWEKYFEVTLKIMLAFATDLFNNVTYTPYSHKFVILTRV